MWPGVLVIITLVAISNGQDRYRSRRRYPEETYRRDEYPARSVPFRHPIRREKSQHLFRETSHSLIPTEVHPDVRVPEQTQQAYPFNAKTQGNIHNSAHNAKFTGYRKVEKDDETEGSGADDCSMMKNPKGMMSPAMMKEGCRSYKEWGRSMKQSVKWTPTEHQMSWWKSLSMPMKERKAHHYSRSKRQARPTSLRKEYRALTDAERTAFHNAVRRLKTSTMDGLSLYDIFVRFHQSALSPGAHFGCAFYPWHRELLYRFERALAEIDPSVTLPYFDSNLDYHLGDDLATQTVTWTADFAGNGDGIVTTGPFAYWPLAFPIDSRNFLHRNLTNAPDARTPPALMSDDALSTILNAGEFRDICWHVDSSFETFHGAMHNWVGGIMVNIPVSPSDPVFFLHHAFIDCLFTWMRDNQRARGIDVDFNYPNDTQAMGVGMRRQGDGAVIRTIRDSYHFSLAEMRPFAPLRNIDGLSSFYEGVFQCAPRPTCSSSDTSCGGSEYLFCDESRYRCAPKLRLGARCQRFSRYSPCSGGECCNGVCQESCPDPRSPPRPQPPTNEVRTQEPDGDLRSGGRTVVMETMHGTRPDEQNPEQLSENDSLFPVPDHSRQRPNQNDIARRLHTEVHASRPDLGAPERRPVAEAPLPDETPKPSAPVRKPDTQATVLQPETAKFPEPNAPVRRPSLNSFPDFFVREPMPNVPRQGPVPQPADSQLGPQNARRPQRLNPTQEQGVRHNEEQPSLLPDRTHKTHPESHSSSNTFRVHVAVPTHAPYVLPTLPPVPTHAPYIVPQAPTHPPGHFIIPPAPTHPPSIFEYHSEFHPAEETRPTLNQNRKQLLPDQARHSERDRRRKDQPEEYLNEDGKGSSPYRYYDPSDK